MRRITAAHRFAITAIIIASSILSLTASTNAQEGKPRYTISVFRAGAPIGEIVVELFPDIAPEHVRNFDSLVSIQFFDSTAFHRVIPGFMIQGGDPNTRSGPDSTWGFGDDAQRQIRAEFNPISHQRGILSAARSNDPNSATSQFFIVVKAATHLDGAYTVYGRVVTGMNIADTVVLTPTRFNFFGDKTQPVQKMTMQIRRTGIDTSAPGAPSLVSPANDVRRVKSNLDVVWTRADSALVYRVEVSDRADFSTIITRDSTADTTVNLRSLPQGRRLLYCRVSASNGGRRGAHSDVRTFTTAVDAPVLVSPASSARDVPKPVQLIWKSLTVPVVYRVQLATSTAFTPAVMVADTGDITDTTLTISNLAPSKRYYWRVFAVDDLGDTVVSALRPFVTDAAASIDGPNGDANVLAELIVRDNGERALWMRIGRSLDVAVSIVDAMGREVAKLPSKSYAGGQHIVGLDTRELAAGAYFARIATSIGTTVRRFVIVE